MRLVWAAMCDKAIIDGISRKLSLIDIPEILIISEPPPADQPVAIRTNVRFAAVFWYGENDDEPFVEARLSILGPKRERQEIGTMEVGEQNKQKNSSSRLLAGINAIPFWGLGCYGIELEVRNIGSKEKWKRVASYPFLLQLTPDPGSTAP